MKDYIQPIVSFGAQQRMQSVKSVLKRTTTCPYVNQYFSEKYRGRITRWVVSKSSSFWFKNRQRVDSDQHGSVYEPGGG